LNPSANKIHQQIFFNRKSISRNTAQLQFWNLICSQATEAKLFISNSGDWTHALQKNIAKLEIKLCLMEHKFSVEWQDNLVLCALWNVEKWLHERNFSMSLKRFHAIVLLLPRSLEAFLYCNTRSDPWVLHHILPDGLVFWHSTAYRRTQQLCGELPGNNSRDLCKWQLFRVPPTDGHVVSARHLLMHDWRVCVAEQQRRNSLHNCQQEGSACLQEEGCAQNTGQDMLNGAIVSNMVRLLAGKCMW